MTEKVLQAIQKGYFDMPFYQRKCAKAGITLSNVVTSHQFMKIPFTTKADLRQSSPYERTRTSAVDIYGLFSSNGTTGRKTFYVYSKRDYEKQGEFARTYYSAIGMKKGGLGAVLGSVGSPVMGHCMMWQFHAMDMGMTLCPNPSPENILELIDALPVTDIATLPQVASALTAKPEWKKRARSSSVERLILGGDFLSHARRRILEELWNAKVFNSFGMSEVFGPIGNECAEQNGFHYISDDIFLEIISPESGIPVPKGELGVGVYTTLWDKGFPLLRYWSGDLMRIVPEPCSCGCGLPRFSYFGRMSDCLRLSDGSWVAPQQVEELTLPKGISNCQVHIYADGTTIFFYDCSGSAPDEELRRSLIELLQCKSLRTVGIPKAELQLRGAKPKYFVQEQAGDVPSENIGNYSRL